MRLVSLYLIPFPEELSQSINSPVESQRQQRGRHAKAANAVTFKPSIPLCLCGASRVFELQLLPSLLHVLQVDISSGCSSQEGILAAFDQGGMNWGNIGIFSCPFACASNQEYVVVQESVDEKPSELPKQTIIRNVLVPEDARFDDENDDVELC